MLIQLDLFEKRTDIELLEDQIVLLEKALDKQRKGLFARHNELCKKYMELNDRFDVLERMLCKGKYGNLL